MITQLVTWNDEFADDRSALVRSERLLDDADDNDRALIMQACGQRQMADMFVREICASAIVIYVTEEYTATHVDNGIGEIRVKVRGVSEAVARQEAFKVFSRFGVEMDTRQQTNMTMEKVNEV